MPSRLRPDAMLCRPCAGAELVEDPLHDRRSDRVGCESVELLAERGLARVRVRPGVDELVAVGRSSAEETALDRGLRGHRRADPGLDPHPFALAHPAVERHHQVVGFGARVDRAADFRYPESDAVVSEHREGEPELIAVERALRFADDDRVEPTIRVAERLEELRGFGSTLPRQRPGLSDVEELGDDLAADRFDHLAGTGQLPVARRRRVLLVLGAHPTVEREPFHHGHEARTSRGSNPGLASSVTRRSSSLRRIRSSTRAAPGVSSGGATSPATRTSVSGRVSMRGGSQVELPE